MADRNIVLVGFMGSGKTVVGREVAHRLDKCFLDTDELVTRCAGMSIPRIFQEHGEAWFREREREAVREAVSQSGTVIAVGGGAISDTENGSDNLELLRHYGFVVYLKALPATLFQRTFHMGDRPLLDVPDRYGRIKNLLAKRELDYQEADLVLSTDALSVADVAQTIMRWQRGLPSGSKMVTVDLPEKKYPVIIGPGVLSEVVSLVGASITPRAEQFFVVTDDVVNRFHGGLLFDSLKDAGFRVHVISIPPGETSKSWVQADRLLTWLAEKRAGRADAIVALGGGVVGDLAGFVASIYKRGIPIVQIPTTLLAQVDSAVGGKAGVDHPAAKNLIGSFWHPELVVCDTDTLSTLPDRELSAGLAEVVKYAVLADPGFMGFLEREAEAILRLERKVVISLVQRCVRIKAEVVALDERDTSDIRAKLNYGHTFAHALETVTNYTDFLHGEAVAIGMTAAAFLSERLTLCDGRLRERQTQLLRRFGLPTHALGVSAKSVQEAMVLDKKEGKFVMPIEEGDVVVREADYRAVLDAIVFMTGGLDSEG